MRCSALFPTLYQRKDKPVTPVTPVTLIMADPELAALRAARLDQLQKSTNDAGEDAEKRRAEVQMRQDLLATALEPAARERRMSTLYHYASKLLIRYV